MTMKKLFADNMEGKEMKKINFISMFIILMCLIVSCGGKSSNNCYECGEKNSDTATFCSKCGTKLSSQNSTEDDEEESVHKHSFGKADCTTPATCSCGETQGEPLGHTSGEKCSRCGRIDASIAIQNAKNTLFIYGIDLEINSVGGVDTYITWKNLDSKEIKYIVFSVQYYNRVKDVLKNAIDNSTTTKLKQTGPIPYGKGNYEVYAHSNLYDTAESLYFTVEGYKHDKENGWADIYWEAPFYNTTTKYAKLVEIEIEYMDGTYYTISDTNALNAIVGDGKHPNAWSTDDLGDDYLR